MTHLEYDEAQSLDVPSLIYILDENYPIPAKDVETGTGAEKRQALKQYLKRRHLVSFFTTPESLQARVMHDVPVQLDKMGIEVTDGLARLEEADETEILKCFAVLPKLFSGGQITVDFRMTEAKQAVTEDCATLRLESGATVVCYNVSISKSAQSLHVYGEREIALALLSIPNGTIVTAIANTAFADRIEVEWTDAGPIPIQRSEKGLVIKEILNITRSSSKAH